MTTEEIALSRTGTAIHRKKEKSQKSYCNIPFLKTKEHYTIQCTFAFAIISSLADHIDRFKLAS